MESALETGSIDDGAAPWVRETVSVLHTSETDTPLVKRIAYSEKGQTIASAYEALNDVIAGGLKVHSDSHTEDTSLVNTLEEASGMRAIVRLQANDYKHAVANVKVALIYSNMGHLDKAIDHLRTAHGAIEHYPDDKNLSFLRDVPTLNQGMLEKSILSAVAQLKEIDNTEDSLKYSSGWWDRVSKFGESLAGEKRPSLIAMSEEIGSRYAVRAWWDVGLLFAFGALCVLGYKSDDTWSRRIYR